MWLLSSPISASKSLSCILFRKWSHQERLYIEWMSMIWFRLPNNIIYHMYYVWIVLWHRIYFPQQINGKISLRGKEKGRVQVSSLRRFIWNRSMSNIPGACYYRIKKPFPAVYTSDAKWQFDRLTGWCERLRKKATDGACPVRWARPPPSPSRSLKISLELCTCKCHCIRFALGWLVVFFFFFFFSPLKVLSQLMSLNNPRTGKMKGS